MRKQGIFPFQKKKFIKWLPIWFILSCCLFGGSVFADTALAATELVTVVYHQGERVWQEEVPSLKAGDTPNLAMRPLSVASGYAIDWSGEAGGVVWDSPFGLLLFHKDIQGVYIAQPGPKAEEEQEKTADDKTQEQANSGTGNATASETVTEKNNTTTAPANQTPGAAPQIGVALPEKEPILWPGITNAAAPAATPSSSMQTVPAAAPSGTVIGWQALHSAWPEAILMEGGTAYIPLNMLPFLGMEAEWQAGKEECHIYLAEHIPASGVPNYALGDLVALLQADLAKLPQQISTCATTFRTEEKNRTVNLKLAAAAINGRILQPGEEFSFNQTVGPRTPEKGYLPATIFVGQTKVEDYGGGICQVSSTLYNAVLSAELKVSERHSHSLPVDYVPKGFDATVNFGTLDFRFQNNTAHKLEIRAMVTENKLMISLFRYP